MEDTASPTRLTDSLKDQFRAQRDVESMDLQGRADALRQAVLEDDPFTPDTARARAEIAILLRRLAEQSGFHQDAQACLACLAALGRPGLLAACRFIREKSFPLAEMTTLFLALPGSDQVALVSELLRRPHLENKDTLSWARNLLPELAAVAPTELVDGLARMAAHGEDLAFPVRETLLGGALGSWLKGIFSTRAKPELMLSAARALTLLRDPKTVRALAHMVAERRPAPSPELLEAMVRLRGAAPKLMIKAARALLMAADPQDAPDCLQVLARLRWSRVGQATRLMANMTRAVRTTACQRAVLLPEEQFAAYVDGFNAEETPEVLACAFAGAATAAPDFLRICLEAERARTVLGHEDYSALDAYLRQVEAGHPTQATQAPVPDAPTGPHRPRKRRGLLARLFTGRQPSLAETLEAKTSFRGLDFQNAELRQAAFSARTLNGANLDGAYLESVRFDHSDFTAAKLAHCRLVKCEFQGCEFKDCDLTALALHDCRFTSCSFTGCDLSWSTFSGCLLRDCVFDSCLLSKDLFHATTLERSALSHCSLAGARLQNTHLRSCRLSACDLSHAVLLADNLAGVEIVDCVLVRTSLAQCGFVHCRLDGCTLLDIRQHRNDGPVPQLVAQRRESIYERLRDTPPGRIPPLPLNLCRGKVVRVLRLALDRWVRWMEMNRFEAAMLAHNERRLDMSLRRMNGSAFFRLLPHLLSTTLYEERIGWSGAEPATVRGYHPDLTTLELAETHFDHGATTESAARGPIIEALYTIGSVGTIAQTRDSDVDYWVCYAPGETRPEQIRTLKRKLDGLTAYAMEVFDLEAHFFLMSVEDVRRNDFGFSDRESSGSAQALLLKDEFYRSMLVVAGLEPVWWVTPPGADEQTYQDYLPQALEYPMHSEPRLIDLGRPAHIPAEELFGAALWQIVKSLHNPYKSVLKLGLLEKYVGSSGKWSLLLCDRIKDNVLMGMDEVPDVDPYGLLFKELQIYYSGIGDRDAVRLLAECLVLKAGVERYDVSFGFPAWHEEKSFLNYLLGPDKATADNVHGLKRTWNFARSMKIGGTVRRFMTGAYKRILTERRQGTVAAAITPEDTTRLGRQVAANFGTKDHKVSRVPFLGIRKGRFPELYFAAEKGPGLKPLWQAFGKTEGQSKISTKDMQLLRKSRDPVMLLTWLAINRLYAPGALVHADRSIAPLSVVEIQGIMNGLLDFLGPDGMTEIEPSEYLAPEVVTRAYLVFNLTTAPDVKRVALANVVYATNWGEVFCRGFTDPGPGLVRRASAFLRDNLAQDMSPNVTLKGYFPKRSQVVRFTLT